MQPFRKAPAGWNRKYKNADENSEKEIRRKVKGKENEEKEDERKTKEKGEEKKPMTGKESRETVIAGANLFTAITFDESTVRCLGEAAGRLRKLPGAEAFQMEGREKYHLTLNFLPQVEDVGGLMRRLDEVRMTGFQLELSRIGIFANKESNVIWMGVTGDVQPLRELKEQVDEASAPYCGLARERVYHPHITLAFADASQEVSQALQLWEGMKAESFAVESFHLFQVSWKSGKEEYIRLATYPLRGLSEKGGKQAG